MKSQPLYRRGKSFLYPLNRRRVGGLQSRSGTFRRTQKSLAPTGTRNLSRLFRSLSVCELLYSGYWTLEYIHVYTNPGHQVARASEVPTVATDSLSLSVSFLLHVCVLSPRRPCVSFIFGKTGIA